MPRCLSLFSTTSCNRIAYIRTIENFASVQTIIYCRELFNVGFLTLFLDRWNYLQLQLLSPTEACDSRRKCTVLSFKYRKYLATFLGTIRPYSLSNIQKLELTMVLFTSIIWMTFSTSGSEKFKFRCEIQKFNFEKIPSYNGSRWALSIRKTRFDSSLWQIS